MTTDMVFTVEQIKRLIAQADTDSQQYLFRFVEKAVLQSPEIQALKKDIADYVHIAAEQATEIQTLLDLLKESRQQLPLAAACWNKDENHDVADANVKHVLGLIARIDAAMQKQP